MAKAPTSAPLGMEKADLRRLMRLAAKQEMRAAFALGGDGKAILILDKRKQPRAIAKEIADQAPDARNPRWGTVTVDPDQPNAARFMVNRASPGMAKKLVIALKGTGFRKIELAADDGSEPESAQDEEDEAGTDTADAPAYRSEDAAPAPDQPGPEPASELASAAEKSKLDAGALTSSLAGLIKRMIGVIANDPSQRTALAELATDAQASLKRGDLAQAAAGIDVLRTALGSTSDAAPQPGAGPTEPASPTAQARPPASALKKRHSTSRDAWIRTREKVDADIRALSAEIMAASEGEEGVENLESSFFAAVEPVLATLDEKLAETLAEAERTDDPAEMARLMQAARATIDRYAAFVASSPIIGHLDSNPFVPMAIGKTLTASLSTLSRAMR